MTNNYLCIHGHFYQPPRENPWLDTIEKEESAAPFPNWNQRINAECYHRNAFARILNDKDRIRRVLNNYEYISFNFGPTLLSWMEKSDEETYQAILNADKRSLERLGHGNALAQVYNHIIMPLANERDKQTQVIWGIHDFEYRFGRKPEGMWLAETAVDTATLEVLAEHDIKFTILSPRQGKGSRKIGSEEWEEAQNDNIDTRRPYLYNLPSGKTITLFFYDGALSQAVAFEGLLHSGKGFAKRLTSSFDDNKRELVHIGTDGESYGHHHTHGEMALAHCLHHIEKYDLAELTNYATYLELFPAEHEAQIHENSSWSCYHGVERWRSNCGCNTGGPRPTTQEWRKNLRELLDWLRDELAEIYEKEASKLTESPWDMRNNYIHWILKNKNISPVVLSTPQQDNPEIHGLPDDYHLKPRLLQLLEMQHNALLMFTSCAWFFDDISGIEPTQVLKYAKRAMEIAKDLTGLDFHEEFLQKLEVSSSNFKENGATVYKEHIIPARLKAMGKVFHTGFKLIDEKSDLKTILDLTDMLNDMKEADIQIKLIEKSQNHYHRLERKFRKGILKYPGEEWEEAFENLGVALGFD
jgi:alpha-amylase/alpha-mannosidase (GH57 family)